MAPLTSEHNSGPMATYLRIHLRTYDSLPQNIPVDQLLLTSGHTNQLMAPYVMTHRLTYDLVH